MKLKSFCIAKEMITKIELFFFFNIKLMAMILILEQS